MFDDNYQMHILLNNFFFQKIIYNFSFDYQISASEDRYLIFWKNLQNFQSILHPSTIWSVCNNSSNGDVISACEDGYIRVFTQDQSRIAPVEEINKFQEMSILNLTQNQEQQFSQEDLKKFQQFDPNLKGKENDVKVFINEGKPQAFSYNNGAWQLIGDAIGSNNFYEGDRIFPAGNYDNIFKVDLGNGGEKPLPFNNGDNPLYAAECFVTREGISKANIEQIRQFLMQQTKGKQTNQPQNQQQKPQQQQIQKQEIKQQIEFKYFPIKIPVFFEGLNSEIVFKKIQENNQELQDQHECLNQKELQYVQNLVIQLSNPMNKFSQIQFTKFELQVIGEKLFKWPQKLQIPIFDLLRVFMLHYQSESLFSTLESGKKFITDICYIIQSNQTNEPQKALLFKLFSNCFNNNSNQQSILSNQEIILSVISDFVNSQNNGLRLSMITLLFNIITQNVNFFQQKFELVQKMIFNETQSQNLLKLVAIIGTLKLQQKQLDITQILNKIGQSNDVLIQECLQDLNRI